MDWRDVPRLSAAETKARIDAGEPVLIVDVRRPTARRGGYIAGDVSHPRRTHAERRDELPRDRALVLY
ncbi:MAG TPA: hypothetical protein VF998_10295 [Candidatus Limnocylindria bacterium]